MPEQRVMVFIDYQNVYYAAREQFFSQRDNLPSRVGHVFPHKLGEMLVDLGREKYPDRVLAGVQVFKGRPDGRYQEKSSIASDRQSRVWEREGVIVHTRPLRYLRIGDEEGTPMFRPQEKGVDVMLALAIAIGARDDDYEIAIVFSSDYDLQPALEYAARNKVVETAVWRSPGNFKRPLKLPDRNIWTHYLDRDKFDKVCDSTNYLLG